MPFCSIANRGLVSVSPLVVIGLISNDKDESVFCNSEITQSVCAIDNLLPRAPTVKFNFSPVLAIIHKHLMF